MRRLFPLKGHSDHNSASTSAGGNGGVLLTRDYWMKDDSSSQCLACLKRFTTFRRRHHCRLCGQVFCGDCAVVVSGRSYTHGDSIRVCKVCLSYNYEDSSDDDDGDEEGESPVSALDDTVLGAIRPLVAQKLSFLSTESYNRGTDTEQQKGAIGGKLVVVKLDKPNNKKSRAETSDIASSYITVANRPQEEPILSALDASQHFVRLSADDPQITSKHVHGTNWQNTIYNDLDSVSKWHLKLFLSQSLAQLDVNRKETWSRALLNAISSISPVEVNQKTDISLDTTEYIRIKEILGLNPMKSCYTNGLVFTKNVALTSMRSKIKSPNIVIIKFPLEYSHGMSQLTSINQLATQNKEYLDKLVSRIASLSPKPDILVAESSVDGYALEALNSAGITVLLNVKEHSIFHLTRLTQADAVASLDRLAFSPRLGHCDQFEIKSFACGNYRKTFAFFTGCSPKLGGTIILRDSDSHNLSKVKHVAEFIIYCMCHLRLESLFCRNFFIELNKEGMLPFKDNGNAVTFSEEQSYGQSFIKKFTNTIFSITPAVIIPLPYLLMQAKLFNDHLASLFSRYQCGHLDLEQGRQVLGDSGLSGSYRNFLERHSKTLIEVAQHILNAEITRLNGLFKLYSRQWENFCSHQPNLLDVSAHQNICFSYSTVNIKKQSYCSFPRVLLVEFYLDYNDCSLGRYIQQQVSQAREPCPESCGDNIIDHYRVYYHGKGKLKVSITEMQCPIDKLEHVIFIWSVCKKCSHKTGVVPMDESTYRYSFAKFLELAFLAAPLRTSSAGQCLHDALKDRIFYFALSNLVVAIEYSDLDLLELTAPAKLIEWDPVESISLKIRAYDSVIKTIETFFKGFVNRLKSWGISSGEQGEKENDKAFKLIEVALQNKTSAVRTAERIFENSNLADYTSINIILKMLQESHTEWSREFSNYDKCFFPNFEKASSLQIFRCFTDMCNDEKWGNDALSLCESSNSNFEQKDNTSVAGSSHESFAETTSAKSDPITSEINDLAISNEGPTLNSHTHSPNITSNIPSKDLGNLENNDPPKKSAYTTKVSMVPKLKTVSTKVREKISQMEALIASNSPGASGITSPKSPISEYPSLRSPTSPLFGLTNPLKKEFFANYPKVSKLKDYFDQMQKEFAKQLEEQRALEKKLSEKNNRQATQRVNNQPLVYENVNDAVNDELGLRSFGRAGINMSQEIVPNEVTEIGCLNSEKTATDAEALNALRSRSVSTVSTEDKTRTSRSLEQQSETDENLYDSKSIFTDSSHDRRLYKENAMDNVEQPIAAHLEGTSQSFELPETKTSEEKYSIFLALKKFLLERNVLLAQNEAPLSFSEHIFAESNVIIREDEPGSLIAFSLDSEDYKYRISLMKKEIRESHFGSESLQDLTNNEMLFLKKQILKPTAIHLKYQFFDNSAILSCKVFFVEQFEALREKCGMKNNFVQSLSRCVKWDANGGKSGSAFLKTLDDRLIVKQLSYSEMSSFVKIAPSYFQYVSQILFNDLPSVLAKIFGFYQIMIRNPVTGKNFKMNVIVMENLFYSRKNLKIFDLKGSMRNRHVEQTGKKNEVLLDENMVDCMFESPIFMRHHNKKLLKTSLWNDTLFLSKINVMDYSLVVGIDHENKEIVAGLIDYVRTFTWDKKLESWVKEKGLAGGGGKRPTVVTPKEYKSRFRAAMDKYVILVPDSWHLVPT